MLSASTLRPSQPNNEKVKGGLNPILLSDDNALEHDDLEIGEVRVSSDWDGFVRKLLVSLPFLSPIKQLFLFLYISFLIHGKASLTSISPSPRPLRPSDTQAT